MINFLTLLFLMSPDGTVLVPAAEFQTAQECSDALPDFYDKVIDGWSVHCHTPEPIVRPRIRPEVSS